ncbi:hypothetical protein IKG41_02970 [Candidatus Saccharibacteria bacterium]|nr:hypothetical protein [Candidatus Saccharibacteria bacterium]
MSKLSTNGLKAAQKRLRCPKCGEYYVGYPALSRTDNKTRICQKCGINEAITIFIKNHNANGR